MSDYLLGTVVRNYRQENHLSLRAFGEMCGISHTTIDCIEKGYDPRTGKRVNITNITFSKLADVLKIPVSTLVDLSDNKKKPIPVSEDGLDEQDRQLVELMKALTPDQKELLLAQLLTLTGRGK